MSEQAAEAPARNPAGKGDGKNIFTRKIGPLPMWAWLAISLAIILAWAWYQNKKNPAAQSGTANASQVPQFVNQTYTTVTPPVAPKPTVPPDKDGKDKDGKGKGGGDHGGGSDGGDDDHKHRKRPRRRHHPTHGGDQASTAPVPAVAPSPPTAAPAPAVM